MSRSSQRTRRHLATLLALVALALVPGAALTGALTGALNPGAADAAPPPRAGSDACGPLIPKPGGGTWQCSFVDHFGGWRVNPDKWTKQSTAWTGFRSGLTCYRPSAKNIAVGLGVLRLVAHDEGKPFTCESPLGDFTTRYTGGGIATSGKFAQTYGRFEVRAKHPSTTGQGVHLAFWLYPQKHTYGPWPASGEIDVAEWWSVRPDLTMPSLHYPGRDIWDDSGWDCVVANPAIWHTYTVVWSRKEMVFSIDGVPCFTRSWTPDSPLVAPAPFDHPFTLCLTMGVGGNSGTNIVSAQTRLPAAYTVDYAKAWR